jgi:predicted MPP superfamily phosphohydrolase
LTRRIPLIFLLTLLIVSCTTIETSRYDLAAPALEGDAVTIVLVTDLHSDIYTDEKNDLVKKIRDEKPDLIFLAGDIIDDKAPVDGTVLLLEGIRGLAPVYYVTGNHEYMLRQKFWNIMPLLTAYGVMVLSDTYETVNVRGNTLIIAGVNDPDKRKYQDRRYNQKEVMEKTFRELDQLTSYKILLAHRPEPIKLYRQFSFDLVVSGHAHGGQVRLPPLIKNGLYAPHQGLFPKYTGGMYTHDQLVHIVSRGLTVKRPFLPRIGNNPDLVVIVLEAAPFQGLAE